MLQKNKNAFYCFSPPVMAATFLIEIGLLTFTLMKYKDSTSKRLIMLILFCLAAFQLAEYNVCGALGLSHTFWVRLGFIMISFLPPLAIHLTFSLRGRSYKWLMAGLYATALTWAAYFVLPSATSGHACATNYAILQLSHTTAYSYMGYYYGLLLAGVILGLVYMHNAKGSMRRALLLQVLGYISFMLPTAIIVSLTPSKGVIDGIPSIMCGFAILYALILTFGVMPAIDKTTK